MKNFLESVVHLSIYAIPFVVLLVTESLFFPFITGKNFTFRILVEIMFAAWVILALYDVKYRPKFSWIAVLLATFVGVMFFANILGVYPFKSFWSNFERMEGYVTIVHVLMYFIVLGSSVGALSQKWLINLTTSFVAVMGALFVVTTFGDLGGAALTSFSMGLVTLVAVALFGFLIYAMRKAPGAWDRLFNATLCVAVVLSWYALAQFFGTVAVSQGTSWRIDGTLGNSSYTAAYMLFHIFIACILFLRARGAFLRGAYGFLVLTFIFILVQTGTRGAILGLFGGAVLTVLYIALFAKREKKVRRVAIVLSITLALLAGLFVAFRDSDFVRQDPRLARIASITLEEGKTRFTIWSMAFEGVKERPVLGWGQGNYDYVFNKYYKPSLYGQEVWFDRVHNIVLDWLIAGGFVGAICYFGIFAAALWYLIVVPLTRRGERTLPVIESGLLVGLLAGYVFQNLFVFDNVTSYILFALMLAYLHSAVATPVPRLEKMNIAPYKITNIFAPIAGIVLIGIVYSVNVPSIKAAGDIIDVFLAKTAKDQLITFERALSRGSFADQEIREQMQILALQVFYAQSVPLEVKQQWFSRTMEELEAQLKEKPGDVRELLITASFYRATGNFSRAKALLEEAHTLTPQKQHVLFEQGLLALQEGDSASALSYYKEAFDLAPDFMLARVLYGAAAVAVGEDRLVEELITTDDQRLAFAQNDLAIRMLYDQKKFALLTEMLQVRIAAHPEDTTLRTNLAGLYAETGEIDKALRVLEVAIEEIPTFKAEGERLMNEFKKSNFP